MKAFKPLSFLLFILLNCVVSAQSTKSYVTDVDDSQITTLLIDAYGKTKAKSIIEDKMKMQVCKNNIHRVKIVKATKAHVARFNKLSTISISKYPYAENFDPKKFNPFLFNINYKVPGVKSAYAIDGTEYYMLVQQKK
ncbi:hypothetical protein [Mesonia aestuariivivens]|uniref:Uncharacterized protein n=1 Tax=Mesonia aestuariivivens TaxID=2796128 RepID=A0ABS6W2B0_9FLAO|nr:hypothetical protein [Mesonia aestuariivivens]MBW2961992.1 hypothetical protein [Mesonia aestuariivivens]